jgi:hypothetical protein
MKRVGERESDGVEMIIIHSPFIPWIWSGK